LFWLRSYPRRCLIVQGRRQCGARSQRSESYSTAKHRAHTILCVVTPATYADLFERLERDEIRYIVVGGIAVYLHGHMRPVADLDLVIDREPKQAQCAL
jgi:hypothetical protein